MTDLRDFPNPDRRRDVADLAAVRLPGDAVPLGAERALLGEGPLWDRVAGELLWVDIDGSRLHRWPGGEPGPDATATPARKVSLAWPTGSGGVLLATADGIGVHDGRSLGPLTRPDDMPEGFRFNDGGCDPSGRLWVASMADPEGDAEGDGTVYRVVPGAHGGLDVRAAITGVPCGNGLEWSPDGRTLYLVETTTKVLYRMAYDDDRGKPGDPEVLLALAEDGPSPDGMAVAADGTLWLATYGGGCVLRLTPDGEPLGAVSLPTSDLTCPAFGPAGSGDLYVTTAGGGPDADDPLAGALFRVHVGVDGLAVRPFAGA